MSGIFSVKDRIAMMNTQKATSSNTTTPEPTSSVENPVRKAGSIADKIAALKASAAEKNESAEKKIISPSKEAPKVAPPVVKTSSSAEIKADSVQESPVNDSSTPVSPPVNTERRLSIKDRIAAMQGGGGSVPIITPASGASTQVAPSLIIPTISNIQNTSTSTADKPHVLSEDKTRPIDPPESLSSLKVTDEKESNPDASLSANSQVGSRQPLSDPSTAFVPPAPPAPPASRAPPAKPAAPVTPPAVLPVAPPTKPAPPAAAPPTVPPVTPPAAQGDELPGASQTTDATTSSITEPVSSTEHSNTKPVNDIEGGAPRKANSIAAKIAALKQQQQKPAEATPPPATDNKDRRRLSSDLKSLGSKINIVLPGAPRPIFPPRPAPEVGEDSAAAEAVHTSSSVDETGELKHVRELIYVCIFLVAII